VDAEGGELNAPLVLRLCPGDELRAAIEAAVGAAKCEAAFVVAGIGSLASTRLRLAGADEPMTIEGDVEILTLSGSASPQASHLHASVSDARGRVWGGHVAPGCVVRTTAEVAIALLPALAFTRERDEFTGYDELVVRAAT